MAAQAFRKPAGSVLFRPGDPCPGFLTLKSGAIRVTLISAGGKEIVLYRVRPGEVCLQTFSCLIEGAPYNAEGVAETNIEAELIPASAFQDALSADEGFRARLFAAVAARFSDFERLVEDLALKSLDARLAGALLRLADAEGAVRLTHDALASELGSGRAAVTRRLAAFADRRLVSLSRGAILIADRRGLAALDAGPVT